MNKYFYVIMLTYPSGRSFMAHCYVYCPEMTYATIKQIEIAATKEDRYKIGGEYPSEGFVSFFHRIEEDKDND